MALPNMMTSGCIRCHLKPDRTLPAMSSSTCPALLTTEWEKPQRTSTSGDSITPDANVQKLGIQMIKAMIAETIEEVEDSDYVDGVTKVYVIHPPQLEDELRCHLSALPVPAISASRSERLISIAVGQEVHHFVVEPYKMDLTRRRSTDPRWLIVLLYNSDRPALGIRVGAQGPLTFKEPTPLLSGTKVAEEWAMGDNMETETTWRCPECGRLLRNWPVFLHRCAQVDGTECTHG